MVPVVLKAAEGVKVVVATEPRVVRPDACVKYASSGTAIEDVVAISNAFDPLPEAEIVTGEEPMIVKAEHDAEPEQDAVVVATD
jgi:hypothetical protein